MLEKNIIEENEVSSLVTRVGIFRSFFKKPFLREGLKRLLASGALVSMHILTLEAYLC